MAPDDTVNGDLVVTDCTFGYSRYSPVFDRLSAEFSPGATVLLGPNGAGKSTLLGLLASIQLPHSGSVTLRGVGRTSDRRAQRNYRRAVAWLPQHAGVFSGLSVREHVAYAGWLKGLPRREAWKRADDALERMELADLSTRRATKLSGGQTRRMQLAGALVHGARVILLDEPTAGLDPLQQERFATLVRSLPKSITTVVATHDVNDLSDAFDRVVVVDAGQVRFTGSVSGFLNTAPRSVADHKRGLAAYSQIVARED